MTNQKAISKTRLTYLFGETTSFAASFVPRIKAVNTWSRLAASKPLALRFRSELFSRWPAIKRHWLLLLFVAVSAGCGSKTLTVKKETTPKPIPSKLVARIDPIVDRIGYECKKGSAEACNALDDNCNGVIDEGCGYSTGTIQVTLGWDTGADIDLYVTDPEGETIYYNDKNRRSSSGGYLDHDARGDCRKGQTHTRIENIYWDTKRPPNGEYKIEAEYWGPCGDYDTTHITVSVSIEGSIIGVFKSTMSPEERVNVANFRIK